jgi:hypothetical protein
VTGFLGDSTRARRDGRTHVQRRMRARSRSSGCRPLPGSLGAAAQAVRRTAHRGALPQSPQEDRSHPADAVIQREFDRPSARVDSLSRRRGHRAGYIRALSRAARDGGVRRRCRRRPLGCRASPLSGRKAALSFIRRSRALAGLEPQPAVLGFARADEGRVAKHRLCTVCGGDDQQVPRPAAARIAS